jgi:DNA-binding NtrC family response regulator
MAQDTTYKTKQSKGNHQRAEIDKRPSLMVVDDDDLVLDFLQEYLKRAEYRVCTAGSGELAISLLAQSPCDIVLVDLKMNGMDGLETIEKITQINPDIVTILMTGFPTLDSSVRAIRLGASDYILKPFQLDEVDLAIKKAVHEHEVRSEMNNLRTRVSELEHDITMKKERITINALVSGQATQKFRS